MWPVPELLRRPLLLIIAGLTVVAAAIVLVLVPRDRAIAGNAVPKCFNEITIFVDTDAEMRQIAEKLGGDGRIATLNTETKQQAYERFKVIFKDRPDLVRLARPEAMPASVRVTAADRIRPSELARQLEGEFPYADKVSAFLPC